PQYGGTFTYAIIQDPPHFDLYWYDGRTEEMLSWWLETLATGDWAADRERFPFKGGSLVPAEAKTGELAESWEIPDDLTYIFHIREGVRWHDKPPMNGRELTAEDIAYNFHRLLGLGSGYDEPNPFMDVSPYIGVISVTATDKYTLEFKLSEPRPLLIDTLLNVTDSYVYIAPPEVIEEYGDMEDWRNAVGTGPFMLVDYVTASSLTLDKNPDYWDYDELHPENQLPYVDHIKMLIFPDHSTRLTGLRTGQVDILITVPALEWEQKETLEESNPDMVFSGYLSMGRSLQMRNDLEPFTDVRVRKALRMAVDTEKIAETYYGGNAEWFTTPLGPGDPYYTKFEDYPADVQEGYTFDPEKAKQLLADAGYPDGFDTNLVMHSGEPVDLMEVVQSMWADIGVNLELQVVDYASRTSILYGRTHDQMGLSWMGSLGIGGLKWYYKDVPWNFSNVDDPVYNEMIDRMELEPDPIKRGQMIKEANMYGASQYFGIGLPMYAYYEVYQPWVGGNRGETTLGGFDRGGVFARLWFDQELKTAMGY
ncbi:MAG: ABC transporter substrate-binding protein, partial [Candidatus Bathyanammoxibius sp.]